MKPTLVAAYPATSPKSSRHGENIATTQTFVARYSATSANKNARGLNLAMTQTFVTRVFSRQQSITHMGKSRYNQDLCCSNPATSASKSACGLNISTTPTFVTRDSAMSARLATNSQNVERKTKTRNRRLYSRDRCQ